MFSFDSVDSSIFVSVTKVCLLVNSNSGDSVIGSSTAPVRLNSDTPVMSDWTLSVVICSCVSVSVSSTSADFVGSGTGSTVNNSSAGSVDSF